MSVIIRCDRCGKEVEKKSWIEMPLTKVTILEDPLDGAKDIDLCDECLSDFLEWLKGEKK